MSRPRIEVILLDDVKLPVLVRAALLQVRPAVRFARDLASASDSNVRPADARLVVTTNAPAMTNGRLGRLKEWFDDEPCPTLVLLVGGEDAASFDPPVRIVGDRSIDFAARLSEDDLAGRLSAMCGLSRPFDVLRRELDALKKRDEELLETVARLNGQLKEAAAIQRDLFREPLPELAGAEIRALYRPAEELSGDVYRVARIDETRIALSMADATGHGLPAAVLSVFIQRMLVAGNASDSGSATPSPGEFLSRLNREILAAQLQQCQFVAALHAVYDEQARTLEWARGGLPLPILVRPGRQPRPLQSDGVLLGVCDDPLFETVKIQLDPGDAVVFHTDGLDALVQHGQRDVVAQEIHNLSWFSDLGGKPLDAHLEKLETSLSAAPRGVAGIDDTTVVVLRVDQDLVDRSHAQNIRGRFSSRLSSF